MSIVSIGSNQNIDTETPATTSGSGPSYTVTFGTTPTGIVIGDIGVMSTQDAGGGNASTYTFLITNISGANITLKYCSDTGGKGDHSPVGLYTGGGSSGSPVQATMNFKRCFSTVGLFEQKIDDSSVSHGFWASTSHVTGSMVADSEFEDQHIVFDQVQSLSSITLTVDENSRHSGAESTDFDAVATFLPPNVSVSGGQPHVIQINQDDCPMTCEWAQYDFSQINGNDRVAGSIGFYANSPPTGIIRNNLMQGYNGSVGGDNFINIHTNTTSDKTIYVIANNIVHDLKETSNDQVVAFNLNQNDGTGYIYNNTVYRLTSNGGSKQTQGVRWGTQLSTSKAYVKNNIVCNLVNNPRHFWFSNSGTNSFSLQDFNMSDTTALSSYEPTGANSLIDQNESTQIKFLSTTAGAVDLFLLDDSTAREAGEDLGTFHGVNIDASGFDRDAGGVEWDMGARQSSRAGAGNPAFFMFLD